MVMKNFCNEKYRDLLAKLGELTVQRDMLEEQIKNIKSQMTLLNSISPDLQKLEQLLETRNDRGNYGC